MLPPFRRLSPVMRGHLSLPPVKQLSKPRLQSSRSTRPPVVHFPNPRRFSTTAVMWTFIIGNNLVFFAWKYSHSSAPDPDNDRVDKAALQEQIDRNFRLNETNIKENRWWTMITSSFLHTEIASICSNMFFFQAFSSLLAVCPGFSGAHLSGLVVGSACSANAVAEYLWHPRDLEDNWPLGAGPITTGVGAAAALMLPSARVTLLKLPLWCCFAAYLAASGYVAEMGTPATPGVGVSTQLVGAVFGATYYALRLRKIQLPL